MKRLGLVIAVLFIAAACGDDGGATTIAPQTPPGPVGVSVVLDDFSFDPETLTVPAGAEVTLDAQNLGGIEHSWVVLSAGPEVTAAADLDPGRIIAMVHVGSDAAGIVSFTAPSAGLYQVICDVPGHIEAGMEGTLIVE